MLLPSTLVAVRPMSKNWSMPITSSKPASGRWNIGRIAATTTSAARVTPACARQPSRLASTWRTCSAKGRAASGSPAADTGNWPETWARPAATQTCE